MTTRSLSRHFVLAFALFCTSWASPAAAQAPAPVTSLSETLAKARETCVTGVAKELNTADPSPRQAVEALRRLAGERECPKIIVDPNWDTLTVLNAVGADLDKASSDYGCTPGQTRAACEGIDAARARQQQLRLLQTSQTATPHSPTKNYTREEATLWNGANDSFGTSATFGTSFMRLTLLATDRDSALTRRARPDVPYRDIRNDVLSATTRCSGCGDEVARAISLYSIFHTLDSVFMKTEKTSFDKRVADLDDLDAEWRAYHFGGGEGRAQLPWELALNSIIYARKRSAEPDTNDVWPKPPKSAVILLHPSPGLAMKDVKGASMVVNVVEVLGWSRWDYDDKTQSRVGEWGGSLVAAYRSRDDAKNWGYGVLLRTPLELSSLPINVVWTRTKLDKGGHDDTVALSVDISRYISQLKGMGGAACLFKRPSCE
jgi:hypothetical protein